MLAALRLSPPARSARLWAGPRAPRRRSDPPPRSPGGGGDGERLGELRLWPLRPPEGRAGHAGCPGPEPRGRASDRGAGRRSGGRAPRPRGLRGAAALLGGRGTGGLVGRWEPRVLGPTCMGRGQGPGDGSLPAASVSQCGCLNREVAVRPTATAGLLHCTAPRLRPLPTAVPTGILFGSLGSC